MTLKERFDWIEKFKQLPTANVADAMDTLELPCGVITGLHPLMENQPRIGGFAATIQQRRRSTAYDGKSLAKHFQFIDNELEPGDLLVVAAADVRDVCTGGSLLCLRAMKRGCVGELTDGSLRDIDEIAALGFPAFEYSSSPRGSARIVETVGTNIPVEICGIPVNPGDFVLMDVSGVVVIPAAHLSEVYIKAVEIKENEDKYEKLINDGMSFAEAHQH